MTKIKITDKSKLETMFGALSYYTFFKTANDSVLMKIPPIITSSNGWSNAICFSKESHCFPVEISDNTIVIPCNEIEIIVSV